MDRNRLLFCLLLVSIALHGQAIKRNSDLERISAALGDKSEDKRVEPDPAKVRADAVDKLLDSMEDATERWRDFETSYTNFLAENSAIAGNTALLGAETGERIKASDILPAEVEAIRQQYRGAVKAIEITRDREELFDSEISLLKHWIRLTQMKEFQIPECTDSNNAALLNAYNMEMVFSDLRIIARGYSFVFETFLSNVYQNWLTCLLSEIAELQQDPDFSSFECEADVATEMKQINFHLSLVLGKLAAVATKFDNTLATFKTAIEGVGTDCYDTGRMLDTIDALIIVGISRRKNEVALEFGAFQRWFGFFTATKRGVDNNKAELVGLLKKRLGNMKFETKIPGG